MVIGIETCKIKVQDMPMEGDFMGDQDMPQPPQDNNQVKMFFILTAKDPDKWG